MTFNKNNAPEMKPHEIFTPGTYDSFDVDPSGWISVNNNLTTLLAPFNGQDVIVRVTCDIPEFFNGSGGFGVDGFSLIATIPGGEQTIPATGCRHQYTGLGAFHWNPKPDVYS